MGQKIRISIFTVVSLFLFIVIIVSASLSPLPQLGEHANQFNSIGMWLAILFIIFLYSLPLLLYLFGRRWALYVMAVFCGFGLLSFLSILLIVGLLGVTLAIFSGVMTIIVTCGIGLIVNLVWFMIAFRNNERETTVYTS